MFRVTLCTFSVGNKALTLTYRWPWCTGWPWP